MSEKLTSAKYVLSDFELLENIGVGSYSFVNKARHKATGALYALKIVEKRHIMRHNKVECILLEKELLVRLASCPYVIKLHGTFQDEYRLYFVLDYLANGDLESFLKRTPSISHHTMRHLLRQLVLAVGALHSNFVIHRDLKPENILLDDNMNIKCIDFGSALDMLPLLKPDVPEDGSSNEAVVESLDQMMQSQLSVSGSYPISDQGRIKDTEEAKGVHKGPSGSLLRAHSFVGTAHYVPPELIQSTPIPLACLYAMDWWSLGVLFYQIFTNGKLPFQAQNDFLIFQKILRLEYSIPDTVPPEAQDLIRVLLKPNPVERLARDGSDMCSFILQHAFFES
jgi:3-phosphoinositide dependent protein kinase-1